MKNSHYIIALTLIFVSVSCATFAQSTYQIANDSKMVIQGTSSLHDWESDVTKLEGKAQLQVQDQQPQFQNFSLTIPVESIKSGKSAMDKNTYEALHEDDYPNIQFTLKEIQNAGQGKITASGNLSIAGVTKPVTLSADYDLNNPAQISLEGSHSFKMTEFGIEPPTAVFGTIKTGDEITIAYTLQLSKTN
ncbi:YceI family protein [Catalinimonas sp. 4WD22]|uniref:YceI family protein n=1 Tax=Catalinimonas locisalis TaxID=3133978 RepID=UPI003100E037